MYRPLIQAAKLAIEAATETAAVESKVINPLLKEVLPASRTGAPLSIAEAAAGNPASREVVEQLNLSIADNARKGTLTLKGNQAAIRRPAEAEATVVQERTGRTVAVQHKTFAGARAARPAEAMSDVEAGNFISNAVRDQKTILAENAKFSGSDAKQLGKFAQMEIYKPLKVRFDQLNKNPNLQLTATADGSAADMVGADFVLFNKANKNYWLLDAKPLYATDKVVPTARGNGLILYGDIFKHNGKGFYFNPRNQEFVGLIENSAANLVNLGNKPSFFSLRQHPLPSMTNESLAAKWSDINHFQKSLLSSNNSHLVDYGKDLNRTLTWLEQTAKERGVMLRSAR